MTKLPPLTVLFSTLLHLPPCRTEGTVATLALEVGRSNHSDITHPTPLSSEKIQKIPEFQVSRIGAFLVFSKVSKQNLFLRQNKFALGIEYLRL